MRGYWFAAATLLLTLLAYRGAGDMGFTKLDDDLYILQNEAIRTMDWAHIKKIFSEFYLSNYHPLSTLSYMLEYRFARTDAGVYHRVNLLLHLLNTLLVFALARRLGCKSSAAGIAALLFGIHPMHVESVAWVSERKDVLYAFFFLSSLIIYTRYVAEQKTRQLLLCLLLFASALLSKSMAVTLPLLLLLADVYTGRKLNRRAWLEKIPFFLLSLAFGIIAIRAQQSGQSIGAAGAGGGLLQHALGVCYALVFYLAHLFAPLRLSAMHPWPQGALPWYFYAAPLILAAVILIIAKTGDKEKKRTLTYTCLFFLLCLLPVLQLIPVGNAFAAERYTYMAYTGFFIAAGGWIASQKSRVVFAVSALWMAWLLLLCHNRQSVWKDGLALSGDMIEKEPELFYGYLLRGNELNDAGQYRAALADFDRAVALAPGIARIYLGRGIARRNTGALKEALSDYDQAIRLEPQNCRAWNNRGNVRALMKDYAGAVVDFNHAVSLDSGNAMCLNNRANALLMMGQYEKAADDYRHVLRLDPAQLNARYNLGVCQFNLGKKQLACATWQTAARMGQGKAIEAIEKHCH